MLAHKTEEDGIACVEYIARKFDHVDYDLVPWVVFALLCQMELGSPIYGDWQQLLVIQILSITLI